MIKDLLSNFVSSIEKKPNAGRWTDEEHERFLQAIRDYGKDWSMVEGTIGTRSSNQIRSHAQKFVTKCEQEPDTEGAELVK